MRHLGAKIQNNFVPFIHNKMPDNMQSFVSLWNALARVVVAAAAATVIISITFLNAQSNNAPFISIMLCTKYMFFIIMIFFPSKLYKMQNIIR